MTAAAPPPTTQDLPPAGLKRLAAKGAVWSMLGFGTSFALRLASNLILTRIFAPEVFGVMALVNTFLIGLILFSDVGIRPSIIQSKRGDDPEFLNTAWTIQVIRGVILWIVAIALAWPFSRAFNDPQLAILLPVAGASSFMMGLYSSKLFSMNRELNLARLTILEIVTQVGGLLVTIILAWMMRSIWAIVIGGLAGNVLKLALTHLALPGIKNRLRWEKEAARQLFTFGRWIFVNTLLTFAVSQSDRLVFGLLVPKALLGIYNLGAIMATLPINALAQISNQVAFPLYTRTAHKGDPIGPAFHETRWYIFLVAGWSLSGLIAGGPTIIEILYPFEYHEAGWIVQILAIGGIFNVGETANSHALLALGQQRWNAIGRTLMVIGMAISIPVGYYYFGFPGAVAGYASAELYRFVISGYAITKNKIANWGQDVKFWLLTAAASAAAWVALDQLHAHVVHHKWIDAGVVFCVASAVWAIPALKAFKARKKSATRGGH